MMKCPSCESLGKKNEIDIAYYCPACIASYRVTTADLIAELRARGGFALAPDAPEVVALRGARSEYKDIAELHAYTVKCVDVCRAAGVIG